MRSGASLQTRLALGASKQRVSLNTRFLDEYGAYVGKYLTPRKGVILKGLVGFRGGTQRVGLSKGGGNLKI